MATAAELADRNALSGKLHHAGWPRLSAPRSNRTRARRSPSSRHESDLLRELRVLHRRGRARRAAERRSARSNRTDSEDHAPEDSAKHMEDSVTSKAEVGNKTGDSKEDSILARIAALDAKLAAAIPHGEEAPAGPPADGAASDAARSEDVEEPPVHEEDSDAVDLHGSSSGQNDTERWRIGVAGAGAEAADRHASSGDGAAAEEPERSSAAVVGEAERPSREEAMEPSPESRKHAEGSTAEGSDATPHSLAAEAKADEREQLLQEVAKALQHLNSSQASRALADIPEELLAQAAKALEHRRASSPSDPLLAEVAEALDHRLPSSKSSEESSREASSSASGPGREEALGSTLVAADVPERREHAEDSERREPAEDSPQGAARASEQHRERGEDSSQEAAEASEQRRASAEAELPRPESAQPPPALELKEKVVISAPESGMAEHMAAFLKRMSDRQGGEVPSDAVSPLNASEREPELPATHSERAGLSLLSVQEEDLTQQSESTSAPVKLAADKATWFNIPKAGGAFANVLATWACKGLEDGDRIATRGHAGAPASFVAKRQDQCSRGFDLCQRPFGEGEGACARAWQDRAGGFVGMFRQPEQRILAGFLEAQGNATDGQGSKALATYAKAQGGCAVKMLNGEECDSSVAVTGDMARLAIQRMESGFAFVGLTEEWALSVCLFHAMFGGSCHSREFHADSPLRSFPYDAAQLEGWVDAFDGALYAHASALFWNRVSQYDVSPETCMKTICVDAVDDFKKSILHKR